MNIHGLALILICQLIGETGATFFHLPVPGPVIGMALLFLILLYRQKSNAAVTTTATGLLSLLGLFYVPAGVGLVLHLPLLAEEWLPILASLVLSSCITLVVTAKLMSRFSDGQEHTQSLNR